MSEARFQALKDYVTDRKEQFENLERFLREHTTYFIGPGSHKYHNNWEGGLLEHSCNVAEQLLLLASTLAPDISPESCVIVGLFHDLGKAGAPGQPYYKINPPTDKQRQWGYVPDAPFVHGDVKPYMTVPHRSLYLLSKFIDLTPEEFQAIMIHDGQHVGDNKSYACKECRLALLAHYADSWSGFIKEAQNMKDSSGKAYRRVQEVKECSPEQYRHLGVWANNP